MRWLTLAFGLVAAVTACSSQQPVTTSSAPASTTPDTVTATLSGVPLSLEVADEPAERAVGLMHRTSVPPGTGMLFRYDAPSTRRYYMYRVPVPLRAVFLREERVVGQVLMPPCRSEVAEQCPTYGPEQPFDAVVETAPSTLPDVEVEDLLVIDRS